MFRNEHCAHARGGNRLLQCILHPEDCDQELSDRVSGDSDEDVHDSIVIDLEDEAYDKHDFEQIDTLSPDQIIY